MANTNNTSTGGQPQKQAGAKKPESGTKMTIGPCRASFVHVWEPSLMEGATTPKYSVSLLIPKTNKALVEQIQKAIATAKEAGKAKWGGKIPVNLKTPLRDGDTERPDNAEYEGHWFINATSTQAPGVVDRAAKPIMQQSEFYSGVYCNASVNFYPFDKNGNKGVAAGLNHVQKVKDGEPLGGRGNAEDEFEALPDDDDIMGG